MAEIKTTVLAGVAAQDAALNRFSNRLATVATDGTICVFNRGDTADLWQPALSWKAPNMHLCKARPMAV